MIEIDDENGEDMNYVTIEEGRRKKLSSTTITLYKTDPKYVCGKLICSSEKFLFYGIRGGLIRVVDKFTACTKLIRGHTSFLQDIKELKANIYISISSAPDCSVVVWHCERNKKNDLSITILCALKTEDKPFFLVTLLENSKDMFILNCDDNKTYGVDLKKVIKEYDGKNYDNDVLNGAVSKLDFSTEIDGISEIMDHDEKVGCMEYNKDFNRCVVGLGSGKLKMFSVGENLMDAESYSLLKEWNPLKTIQSLHFCKNNNLIIGGNNNSTFGIWEESSESINLLQTLTLTCNQKDEEKGGMQNSSGFVGDDYMLLSNIRANTFFIVQLKKEKYGRSEKENFKFEQVTEFNCGNAVLSFTAMLKRYGEDEMFGIFCVKTTGVELVHIPVSSLRKYGGESKLKKDINEKVENVDKDKDDDTLSSSSSEEEEGFSSSSEEEMDEEDMKSLEEMKRYIDKKFHDSQEKEIVATEEKKEDVNAMMDVKSVRILKRRPEEEKEKVEKEKKEVEKKEVTKEEKKDFIFEKEEKDEEPILNNVSSEEDILRQLELDQISRRLKGEEEDNHQVLEEIEKKVDSMEEVISSTKIEENILGELEYKQPSVSKITELPSPQSPMKLRSPVSMNEELRVFEKNLFARFERYCETIYQGFENDRMSRLRDENERQRELLGELSKNVVHRIPVMIEEKLQRMVSNAMAKMAEETIANLSRAVTTSVDKVLGSVEGTIIRAVCNEMGKSFKEQKVRTDSQNRQIVEVVRKSASQKGLTPEDLENGVKKSVMPLLKDMNDAIYSTVRRTVKKENENLERSFKNINRTIGKTIGDNMKELERNLSKKISKITVNVASPIMQRGFQFNEKVLLQLIEEGKYAEAIEKVLSLRDAKKTTWLIKRIDPTKVLEDAKLPPHHILSLLNQLATTLNVESDVKILWILSLLLVLDWKANVVKDNMKIFGQVLQKVTEFHKKSPSMKTTNIIIVLAARVKLSEKN